MSTNNSNDINSFTKALWWIAGAAPEILIKYPSEYAKYSAIGMTISMTCLVAFVSGMAAAWYFSSSILASLGFGLFWALLIFCIDRALVVTMKKTVDAKTFKKKFSEALGILIPRAILAVLVALLMSIPLELIVFEDIINAELSNYESKKLEDSSKIGYEAMRKADAEEREAALNQQQSNAQNNREYASRQRDEADKEVKVISEKIASKRAQLNKPTTAKYNLAYNDMIRCQNQLKSQAISDGQRKALSARIYSDKSVMKDETQKWNDNLNNEIKELQTRLDYAQRNKENKEKDLKDAMNRENEVAKRLSEQQDIISQANNTINDRVESIDSIQKNTNRFILHYSVLEYAVYDKVIEKIPVSSSKEAQSNNGSDSIINKGSSGEINMPEKQEYIEVWHYRNKDALIMLWLIRILFFVFEMMPTVVKAVSKPGPYERECEAQDRQMADFFTSSIYSNHMQTMLSDKLLHEKQLAEDKRNAERALHDHVLSKIQEAQSEVAINAIDKWRKAHLQSEFDKESNGNLKGVQTENVEVNNLQSNISNRNQSIVEDDYSSQEQHHSGDKFD